MFIINTRYPEMAHEMTTHIFPDGYQLLFFEKKTVLTRLKVNLSLDHELTNINKAIKAIKSIKAINIHGGPKRSRQYSLTMKCPALLDEAGT